MKKISVLFAFVVPVLFTFCEVDKPQPSTLQCIEPLPSAYVKVYETSFENVKSKNEHELAWNFPHWFEYAAKHQEDGGTGNGLGGARMWVDDARSHTGNKSIGLELFDIERSRTSEFVIYPQDYVGEEYYISYWLFIPADWGLFDPDISLDWFEIGNPYISQGLAYSAILISRPDSSQTYFSLALGIRDQEGNLTSTEEKRLLLPKNRWFQVIYYVRRDKVNGEVKLWFDCQLIAEKSGFPTAHIPYNDFSVSIAKIYHDRRDKVPHQLWIDDFSLYAKVP